MLKPLRATKRFIWSLFKAKRETIPRKAAGVRLWLEALEDRLAPATVSDGGSVMLSITLGANENLGIVSVGTSYTFTSNQVFSATSGADPVNQATAFSGFGTSTLTLTSAGLAQYGAGLTIGDAGGNASVTFNDSGTNAYASNFNVALSNAAAGTIAFNGSSNFGAFSLQAATTRDIRVLSGASLASSSGNVTLQANQQATPTAGDFAGITVANATIVCTGSGLVTLQGHGGNVGGLLAGAEDGVDVENGGTITGGTGALAVTGAGGVATSGTSPGVNVSGTGSLIQSSGGSIEIKGLGGRTAGGNTYGVLVGAGGQLSTGSTGGLTVVGTGGTGPSDFNDGVVVEGTDGNNPATITSLGANVQVTGQGGEGQLGSSSNYGVFVGAYGQIEAGGNGSVTVIGIGGTAPAQGNHVGVYVAGANATITSGGGNVLVTGQGGSSGPYTRFSSEYGVVVGTGGTVSAAGNGGVSVVGTGNDANCGLFVSGGTITSSGGSVNLTGNEGVWVLGLVTAGGNGAVTVVGTADGAGNVNGVIVGASNNSTAAITSSGGNVLVAGQGGNRQLVTFGNSGVVVYGRISAGGNGSVVVQGVGGTFSSYANIGVEVTGMNATITSNGGSVTITGIGGTQGSHNFGVEIDTDGTATAGGAGTLTVQGTGGTGLADFNCGVYVNVATITSSGGNVQIIGQGGGSISTGHNFGVSVDQASIIAGGSGSLTIQGTGGATTGSQNYGVNSTVSGIGNDYTSGDITTHGGNLAITGVAGTGPGGLAMSLSNVGSPQIPTMLVGDSMELPSINLGVATLTLVPQTNGMPINLGDDNPSGILDLTSAELSHIQAGNVRIGNAGSGTLTISAAIMLPTTTKVTLTSGGDILFSTGSMNTRGGALTLAPGNGAVLPVSSGMDIIIAPATLKFAPGSNLAITVNGAAVDTQYNQLNVAGGVDLTGVALDLSGDFPPFGGQSFTIVNNQGNQPVTGTFNGLPEGMIIPNFLGSPYNAAISYVGGDGNDVVINRIPLPATRFQISAAASATSGIPISFTVVAEDRYGNPSSTAYSGTVHFSSGDNFTSLPANTTLTNGVGIFSATMNTLGIQSISASDTVSVGITGISNPISVSPAATQFAVTAPSNAVAGSAFLVTVTARDGSGRTATGYTGTVHLASTDGHAVLPLSVTLTNGIGSFLVTLKTAGTFTVTASNASVTTITGTSGNITVSPAATTYFALTFAGHIALTGTPVGVTVTALDSFGNTAVAYRGTVHFTSSDASAALPPDATLTKGTGTFNLTWNNPGTQKVTAVDVSSLTKAPLITGTSAAITTRGLVVTSVTPNASGFVATFSKPFIPADLTLYGSGLSTVQDVTLVGKTSGSIVGSLLLNATDTGITFVASENSLNSFQGTPILPDDTYTVIIASGSGGNGFLDGLNAGLDGANNGGHANYTNTFIVANSTKPTLSIPDFARGPDAAHTIKVPNDSAGGIPITLANVAGVTDVTFVLSYDPTLLTPTAGATADSTNAGTATFAMTTVDATHVKFHYTNSAPQSGTLATPLVLGDIVATVPNSAASLYKAKELLNIGSAITINGGAALTPATGAWANGVHVNAYFGDVTGNGTVDGLDVATANNVAQGKATGFAAYSLLDPAIVGDVAADISVDAGDVSTLASFVAKLPIAQIPVIPTGITITPVGADPTLGLAGLQPSGGILNIAVLLDCPHPVGSTGMDEAILALGYDPKALNVSSADITLGSIPSLGAGWQLTSVVDQGTGQICIELFSTTAITATQAGSLVNIAFHVVPGASVPATAVQLVSSVTPGGQQFTTQVDDAQGQYVLSPGMDRLVVPTGLGPVPTTSPPSIGSADAVIAVHGHPAFQNLALESDGSTGTTRETVPVECASFEIAPFGLAATLALALPSVAVPLNGQTFQIGSLPQLNTFLYRNSPALLAAEEIFLALARSPDTPGDAARDNLWNIAIWQENASPTMFCEIEGTDPSGAPPREQKSEQSVFDGLALVDMVFAQLDW